MALILLQGCSGLGSCSRLSQDSLWSAAELDVEVLKLILFFPSSFHAPEQQTRRSVPQDIRGLLLLRGI